MATYRDYYGQPTKSEAVANEAMRRNERDLARAQAEGKEVGVDYYGQPTTDPILIERGAARNLRDSARATDIDNASIAIGGGGSGGSKPVTDEELTSGRSAMKKGGKVKKMASGGMTSKVSSASRRADGIATKGKTKGRFV
jgi:hypothetical protein